MKQADLHRPTDAELMRVIRSAQTYREKYIAVARLQGQDSIRRVALDNGLNWKVRKAAVCRLQDTATLSKIAAHDRHDYLRSMAERRLNGAAHPTRISRYSAKNRHYDWKYPVFFKVLFENPYHGDDALIRLLHISRNTVWLCVGGERHSFLFCLYEETLPAETAADILASLNQKGSFSVLLGGRRFWGKPVLHHEWNLRLHADQYGFNNMDFICRAEDFIEAVRRDLQP